MRATLFDHLPAPAPPRRVRLRERRHPCDLYVRKVKGAKYQLRIWAGKHSGGSVNCGLYDDEAGAEKARRLLVSQLRGGMSPLAIWEAMKPLITAGVIPERVLPMYVRRTGEQYCARVRKGGGVIQCPGPFESPEAAHRAMVAKLATEFPTPAVGTAVRELATLTDFLTVA